MQNEVYINDQNLIIVYLRGAQTGETIKNVYEQTAPLLAALEKDKKPKLLLADISGVTTQDLGARVEGSKFFALPLDKEAIFGAKPYIELIASLAVRGAGATDRVAIFKTRQQAIDWLYNDQQKP